MKRESTDPTVDNTRIATEEATGQDAPIKKVKIVDPVGNPIVFIGEYGYVSIYTNDICNRQNQMTRKTRKLLQLMAQLLDYLV
jgi:hypothetical protein